GYQNIVANGPLSPTSLSAIGYYEKWPSIQQFSFGVQHQFSSSDILTVSYVGNLGRHLQFSTPLEQIPDGMGIMNVPALAGKNGCDANGNCDVQSILINRQQSSIFFVPYRGYSSISFSQNTAISNYNSLQTNFRHSFSGGLTLQVLYTWAHALDNDACSVDCSDTSRWYATSNSNETHVFQFNYTYELPFFKRSSNRFLSMVLGGWELSGISTFFTGQPMDFSCGINGKNTGIGSSSLRCDPTGPVTVTKGTIDDPQFGPTPAWISGASFAQPTLDQLAANGQPGMFGYMGRNVLNGPGRNNWDMALHKDIDLPWFGGERSRMEFRWETFNTFNHSQWSAVKAGCNGQTAPGAACSGSLNPTNGEVSSTWDPRIMQFGLKLIF
ncbi:MAG TPA: hypothetical protein VG672_14430, partial [Bryobacteraceae bacterium]|nr:hypothetical protein [Bryobacteraceae bacterium]